MRNKINPYLLPLSWLYGLGVGMRNKLFDLGWLRSRQFDLPVICVGNLAVGGTGKTPHTEYLIRLLQQQGLHPAVLSRGYKRKSRGYILAHKESNAGEIGDEPYQMKSKYPGIRVAVDADRCHGIDELLKLGQPAVDTVLLDDAFQHRYVKAGLNILLTDYHRLFSDDALMPAGQLREPIYGRNRAQIVIVTKCPDEIKPIDFNLISKRLRLFPYQSLFFTRLRYGDIYPLFPEARRREEGVFLKGDEKVLLVTGIASPNPLAAEIKSRLSNEANLHQLIFGDHHDFSSKDLQQVKEHFLKLDGRNRLIVTTEKDAARLKQHPALDEELKPFIQVLPVEIEFLRDQQDLFNQNVIDYVRKNPRNSSLPERKDAHTA